MIRVLIVDDSAVLRQSTRFILESDRELSVIGEASNGAEALAMTDRLHPDVITMDIRMPKMDGMEAIREIMATAPAPIIVVTSVDVNRENELAARATKLGAVSVMRRPEIITSPDYRVFAERLIRQVKAMSSVKVIHRTKSLEPALAGMQTNDRATAPAVQVKTQVVAIGSSTGGPAALHEVLSRIPKDFALPILIVQHISFGFVDGLASWLNDTCPLQVSVAKQGERIEPGKVYIAPDEHHMTVDRFGRIGLMATPPVGGHRPAVTTLFQSLASSYGAATLAVILTGMGDDGAVGMKALHATGAITVAQDQYSCVVFGMPKEAIALGAIRHVVSLNSIAQKITELII